MTPLQTLEIRASEIRERLATIGGLDELTDETRAETDKLRREYSDNETRQRALKIAGDGPPAVLEQSTEGRALRELVRRSSVGEIYEAALSSRQPSGATAELLKHYHLDGNQVPLALLRRYEDEGLETRAATQAPGNVGSNQAEIIPAVFPMACAAFLGVDMPVVGVGEATFPVLTTSAIVGTPAEGATPAGTGIGTDGETTGAFTAEALSPARLQAAFFYSREDRARFQGMSESLRMNLNDALMDKYDAEILAGTNGLLTGTNLANHDVTVASAFAHYRDNFAYGRVDGKYAMDVMDLRAVMGSAIYAHAATAYRANNADDSALDVLMAKTSGVKVFRPRTGA